MIDFIRCFLTGHSYIYKINKYERFCQRCGKKQMRHIWDMKQWINVKEL